MGAREEMIEAVAHTIQHGYWEGVTETIAREAARQTLAPWLPDDKGVPADAELVGYQDHYGLLWTAHEVGDVSRHHMALTPLYRFRPSAVPTPSSSDSVGKWEQRAKALWMRYHGAPLADDSDETWDAALTVRQD